MVHRIAIQPFKIVLVIDYSLFFTPRLGSYRLAARACRLLSFQDLLLNKLCRHLSSLLKRKSTDNSMETLNRNDSLTRPEQVVTL
jgi:hypothetical protein